MHKINVFEDIENLLNVNNFYICTTKKFGLPYIFVFMLIDIYLLPYTNVFSRIQNKIGTNTFVFVPTQKK